MNVSNEEKPYRVDLTICINILKIELIIIESIRI
jgi:hypothetical protein